MKRRNPRKRASLLQTMPKPTAISQEANSGLEIAQPEGGAGLSQPDIPQVKSDVIPHYEPHPLALLLPPMEDDEAFDQFVADIKQGGGVQEPIVLYEGKVLDGVQRQRACERAGVTPQYSHWEHLPDWKIKAGPLAFVISHNLHRRHLTTQQRADVAAKMVPLLKKEAEERQTLSNDNVRKPGRPEGSPAQQAAALLNVSRSSVERQRREQGQKIEQRKKRKPKADKKPTKRTLLNGDDVSKVFNEETFADKLHKKWARLINRVDADKQPSAMRLIKEWIEFVERVPLAAEDNGWDLIKRWRTLRNKYAHNRREQVSELVKGWILCPLAQKQKGGAK